MAIYITREAQPIYLRSLDYNICRVFEELAKNIEGAGGRVKRGGTISPSEHKRRLRT